MRDGLNDTYVIERDLRDAGGKLERVGEPFTELVAARKAFEAIEPDGGAVYWLCRLTRRDRRPRALRRAGQQGEGGMNA